MNDASVTRRTFLHRWVHADAAPAQVGDACLTRRGIACESCRDACEHSAIRMRHRVGGVPVPVIDPATCTGCGACVRPCPVNAIVVAGADPHG